MAGGQRRLDREPDDVTDPRELERLSELHDVFTLVDRLGDQLLGLGDSFPQAGSSLKGDDAKTPGYQLSHLARAHIGVALDQIHALDNLVTKAESLHPFATFPLIRAAVENAGTALWLMQPASRVERVTRRWRLAVADSDYSKNFHTAMGGKLKQQTTHAERVDGYQKLAAKSGITDRLTKATTTTIMREVDASIAPALSIEAAWQICSGISHGQLWAILMLLDRELEESGTPGVHNARLTAGLRPVLWGANCAYVVIKAVVDMYIQRGRCWY